MKLLYKAVGSLPEIQRRRFLLYYEYEFNFYQIAAMEHCTASAIQKSVAIAKEKVKAEIEEISPTVTDTARKRNLFFICVGLAALHTLTFFRGSKSIFKEVNAYVQRKQRQPPERRKAMQKLQTVNAETLLYEPLEKPSFVVDSLIPTGLSLFCGSQKIGKSWLMLKLCLCVSQGIPLWDMTTMEGDVLYLCLEDTFCRIQDRLFRLTDEASGRLHFAVASCKLSDGLIVQLEDYLKDYPDSRLIVIDTLQKVRTASKDNAYASDYGDISLIKDFADRHSLAVIVVHHIRKQNDSDVFNKVSGTTGLTGSADATFVLEKEKRASDTAKLYVTGRDTPYQEYTLRFRDCSWELVERKTQEQLAKETIPDVLFRLVDFMRDKEEWAGTATELLAAMGETETIPTVITKWLNEYHTTFLSENRICYQYSRRKDGRQIALARRAGDSGDGGDSDIGIPPVTVIDA